MYNETCAIRHALGEDFCVGIDRVSIMQCKTHYINDHITDYSGIG